SSASISTSSRPAICAAWSSSTWATSSCWTVSWRRWATTRKVTDPWMVGRRFLKSFAPRAGLPPRHNPAAPLLLGAASPRRMQAPASHARVRPSTSVKALPRCFRGSAPSRRSACWLFEQGIQRLLQTRHGDYLQPGRRFLGCVALGHDGTLETVLGGFLQTFLTAGHRPDLAGQAHLAEHQQIG